MDDASARCCHLSQCSFFAVAFVVVWLLLLPVALRARIMREYKELTVDAPFENDACTVQPKNDDYMQWQATLTGPAGQAHVTTHCC